MAARAPTRVVDAERWIATLADPAVRLELPQLGCSRCHERWVVMPRAIPEHLVYLVVEGTLHGAIGSRPIRLQAGDWCWVMPWVLHEFRLPERGPRPIIHHLKLILADPARGPQPRLRDDSIMVKSAMHLGQALDEAEHEVASAEPYAALRLRAALILAFSGALRLAKRRGDGGVVFNNAQRERLTRHAREHLTVRLLPTDLAEMLGMNADYFTRVFRRSFGIAPRSWLMRERMLAAAERLRDTDRSIAEIAGDLGHADIFLFSRQFKQVFGQSPTRYRQRQ
jgi:AraC-like DNA-binding protein